MILDSTKVLVIALICYFILPIILMSLIKNTKTLKIITWIFLAIYLGILLLGVWARVSIINGVVRIEFDYSYGFFNKGVSWGFLGLKTIDVLLNLVMLMPIGVASCILSPKPFVKHLIGGICVGLILGIVIEFGQFILPVNRSVQLSDVIFNAISVCLGVIAGKLMMKITKIQKGENLWEKP